jgi:hypothetical protein
MQSPSNPPKKPEVSSSSLIIDFCKQVDAILRRAGAEQIYLPPRSATPHDFLAAHHDSPDYACGRDLKD